MSPNAMRQVLLSSIGLVVALTAPAALAQTENAATDTLEVVVITAERREVDLQNAALAVTAIDGELVGKGGVTNLVEILQSVPSVQAGGAAANSISIRGIGTDGVNKQASTALYLDGITVSTGLGGYSYDIARVEVLAGPQGTLYGGTATGGAINVITNSPKLNTFEALAQGEAGSYSLKHGTAMVNLPASSTFALRLAGDWQRQDSYASKKVNGVDQYNLRAKALWEMSDRLSLLLGADFFKDKSLGANTRNVNFATGEPIGNSVVPLGSNDTKVQKYYLNFRADLGFGDLTYIPGIQLRDSETLSLGSALGMRASTPNGRYHTQELRLASQEDSKVIWVAGLYYYKETSTSTGQSGDGTVQPFVPFSNVVTDLDKHQSAVFGQATYPLTDTFRLTAGARYSADVARQTQVSTTGANTTVTPFVGKYHSTDYLARLESDLSDNNLLYLSYSTGYRPGGLAQAPNAYGNEKIKAYEIGSKNSLLDNRLTVNGDIFYYDYSGFQVGLTVPCAAPGQGSANCFVFDVGTIPAEFKGAELTVTWALTAGDTLSVSPTYIDSKYTDSIEVARWLGGPVVPLPTSGHVVTRTSKWAANASYQHTFALPRDQSLFARVEANFRGDLITNFDPCIYSQSACTAAQPIDWLQKEYTLYNASAGYSAADQSWQVNAYIRNIEDRVYKSTFGPSQAGIGAPRTYGVTASKRW